MLRFASFASKCRDDSARAGVDALAVRYSPSRVQNPSNTKLGREPSYPSAPPPPMRLSTRARRFMKEHGHKLWWLHSAYALALGTGVVAFNGTEAVLQNISGESGGGKWEPDRRLAQKEKEKIRGLTYTVLT